MGLFNRFVDKAKNKLDDAQNPQERVTPGRYKDPNARYKKQQVLQKKPVKKVKRKKKEIEDYGDLDDLTDEEYLDYLSYDDDEQISLFPAQKPESFHFFILENQYQDLERAIRGVKDVWEPKVKKWLIKRKDNHCFTDEESEEIVRTAQSHLSSDIKLAILNRNEYPILLDGIYNQLWVMFKQIMDYRFGRFGSETKQMEMKQQAVNIFNMLMMRIKANYSRAIEGRENTATHDSVKGQESLNQTERKDYMRSYT